MGVDLNNRRSASSACPSVEVDCQPNSAMADKNNSAGTMESEHPSGWKMWLTYAATLLTVFLVPLDMTIVATAIPKITEEFSSLDDVGWYGSAFFLTLAVFQSTWGKIFKYNPIKISYVASIFVFELGSLICGVARNSQTLIAGRVIAGFGGAGIAIGTYLIVSHIVPPSKAPVFIGGVGVAFSIASVAGPLVGGVFTGEVSWRWCFYVNLPIGGLASFVFFVLFPKVDAPFPQVGLKEKILQLDLLGATLAAASIVCYLLALKWGGISKSWGDADVVGALVGSVLLAVSFGLMQWLLGHRASISPRILAQRHVASCSAFIFLFSSANFLMIYNLPLYFQSVKGSSPTLSGIEVLPLIVSSWASFTALGAGLLYTLGIDSSAGEYIGFQFVVGFGNGICQQIPLTVVQAFSKPEDLATSMSTVLFFQLLSGALSIAAAQSVFVNRLIVTASERLPNIDRMTIILTGATDLYRVFAGDQLLAVRKSYLDGLRAAWAMAIALAGIALLGGLALGFNKIDKSSHGGNAEAGVQKTRTRHTV